jgi:hypothetical protein
MITVLVMASSPVDQGQLHLGKELKLIKHSLDSASNRDHFRVESCTAATVDDLRRYLVEHNPTVVHFCGHGAGAPGLCFEDDGGATHVVDGERLAKLFHLVNEEVKCVVLNACLSEAQAKAISEHIDFVVGMKEEIGDAAALKFAQGFYEAFWAGQSMEKAFKFGCSAINTANIPEDHIPVLLKSPRLGGMKLAYSEDVQKIENFILRFLRSEPPEQAKLTVQGDQVLAQLTNPDPVVRRRVWSAVRVLSMRTVRDPYKEVKTVLRSGTKSAEQTFYLKTKDNSFLIDWDATIGSWPMPFKTYKALGVSDVIRVRVVAELDDYFNYGFAKADGWVSVRLRHISGGYIHGFLHTTLPDREPLVKHLYDGKSHRLILDIFPGPDTSCVHIAKLAADSWVMPGGAEVK